MKNTLLNVPLIVFPAIFLIFTSLAYSSPIVKSPNDDRTYKSIQLPNQLEVIVISDPETDIAAAALSVGVGFFQDPKDRPGLAHFLEHMLFLGNKKYPVPGEFDQFVSKHGGSSNATTGNEETTYYFSIQDGYLQQALDRFSQFFISPTFDPKFIDKEINAVQSEYQKSIKHDSRRVFRVIRTTANQNHPFGKFGMGNSETLRGTTNDVEDLYQSLKEFYFKYYSGNIMKLVVLGKESIPVLETWVREMFSEVANRNVFIPISKEPVIDAALPRMISVKPVKKINELRFMFPIDSLNEHYQYKPAQVLSSLLGDEGKGSLLSYLKLKAWVTSLMSMTNSDAQGYSFFEIRMGLTEEGVHHTDEIAEAFYQFLELIRDDQNRGRYYQELRQMAEIQFRFQEKVDPFRYVTRLAHKLHQIPAYDVLAASWKYEEYRKDLEEVILKKLTPANMQMVLVAEEAPTSQTESLYQVEYDVTDVAPSVVAKWQDPKTNGYFGLPPANPFIPREIHLKTAQIKTDVPVLLKNGDRMRIWFKHDDVFNVPKANLRVMLSTPAAYASPKEAAMTRLFVKVLKENLNEFAYPAYVAGLKYSMHNSVRGIVLTVGGYAENMDILLTKIVQEFNRFKVSEDQFEVYKEQMLKQRMNQKLASAYRRTRYETMYFLSETFWHFNEYLAVIDDISIAEVQQFIPKLLSQIEVEILAHGNFSRDEVQSYGAILEKQFLGKQLKINGQVVKRTMNISSGKAQSYAFSVEDVNSAILVYFQVGPKVLEETVMLDMLNLMMAKPFFHQLRTIEQLGYLVSSNTYQMNKVNGFSFLIQSGNKDPQYLQDRINQFLIDFKAKLENFSAESFEEFRMTAIDERLEDPKNLNEETSRYWNVVTTQSYDFQFQKKEIKALKSINLQQLIAFYQQVFLSAKTMKRINFQAWDTKLQLPKPNAPNMIADPQQIKQTAQYYDNPIGNIE